MGEWLFQGALVSDRYLRLKYWKMIVEGHMQNTYVCNSFKSSKKNTRLQIGYFESDLSSFTISATYFLTALLQMTTQG